jgi:hypothetical protein
MRPKTQQLPQLHQTTIKKFASNAQLIDSPARKFYVYKPKISWLRRKVGLKV